MSLSGASPLQNDVRTTFLSVFFSSADPFQIHPFPIYRLMNFEYASEMSGFLSKCFLILANRFLLFRDHLVNQEVPFSTIC